MNLGNKIKSKRKERGLSQRELSRLSGVSEPFISQLEGGSRGKRLGYQVAIKLAKGLKVPVSFFVPNTLQTQKKNYTNAEME